MTSPDTLLAGAEFAEPAATSLAATRQRGSTLYASGQIGVRALPLGTPVEVDAIFSTRSPR
jgi:hypothetical protein